MAPARANTLVPRLFVRAVLGVIGAAPQQDPRHVGIGLHVVQQRGLAPQTALRRERRTRPRLTPIPFDRREQGGLFAAHERAGSHADFHVELKTGAQHVRAQQAARAPGRARLSAARPPADTRPARR